MSGYQTDPSRCAAAGRSRLLADGERLDPPARMPVLFGCRYQGFDAAGCVYPGGVVCVVPHRLGAIAVRPDGSTCVAVPCFFASLRAVERSAEIEAIVWEWRVARLTD